ncbi:S4 domain-containing protein, partial [Escherichia coli]|nr:S4 domain-containing protein [Escherichia coli]
MKEKPAVEVRLDKWLWAARFYKTRALAREMIEGGKVHSDTKKTSFCITFCFHIDMANITTAM